MIIVLIIYEATRLDCEDKTRDRFADPVGALPDGGAAVRGNLGELGLGGGVSEACDGEGSVEVLPDLGDYPIRDGPGVDPGDLLFSITALHEDDGADSGDGLRIELKRRVAFVAGEQAHQKLVGGRTMEPPLEVRSHNRVHGVHVTGAQRLIEFENYQPLIAGITTGIVSFLR